MPQGDLFGEPFRAEDQRAILETALDAVASIAVPGTILEHPKRWRMAATEASARGD